MRKPFRILLYSASAIVLMLVICNVIINLKIEKKLKMIFSAGSNGTTINFSKASANIFSRSVFLDSVNVVYQGTHTRNNHEFILPGVRLSGIHIFDLLFENRFVVNKISIEDGIISLDKTLLLDTVVNDGILVFPFNEFSAGAFEMKNMDVRIHSDTSNEISWKGDLALLKIKSLKNRNNVMENIHPDEFRCELQDVDIYLPESHKTIFVRKFIANSKGSYAMLDSITCVSDFPMKEFSRKMGFQADWVDLFISKMDLKGLDVISLLDNKLYASKITVHKSRTHIYRDRSIPRRLIYKKLPVDMLRDITQDIRIDTVIIEPATFSYEEFPEEGFASGIIRMDCTMATIHDLNNHPRSGDPDHISMDAQTSLMGSGTYTQSIYFPQVKGKNYKTEGSIRNLDLTKLNSSSENLGQIHIESGMLNDLTFQFDFNDENATGTVTGDYNNLKLDKLKLDNNNKLKKAPVKTILERAFIIPVNRDRSVPADKRTGKVDVRNDPTRFTSFYIMQALLSGIRSSFPLGFLI
jgi:hypothetical protein